MLISGKKDLFPKNMSPKQIERAVREAYSNIKVLKSQDERILGRGTSDNMIIEIWVNKVTKKIETAYPKGVL
ncbi:MULTISPECIES: EndoU domain-containing protein [unclassified Gilliamella]|uniref:EndoU domain-containing protein n=1 Tax=unclassified Gilliamella TaxID=2685620 RepID=UPI0027B982D7|nr:EndoU domain-containing protein [Gilliamella apicola]